MENFNSVFDNKEEPQSKTFSSFDKKAWAEKKQAERRQVFDLIDKTAERMAQDGKMFQSALDVMAKFDRYSVGNILLITAQKPEATKLADFDTWKASHNYVRKGEDHIKILEPGEEFKREDGSMGVNYNVRQMFDISQTSAQTRPAQVRHDARLLLKAMIRSAPCPVEINDDHVPDGIGAVYNSEERKIYVRQGMDGPDIFRCLVQELCHAQLDKGDSYNRGAGAFTAYCATYTLCRKYGVDAPGFNFQTIPGNIRSNGLQAVRSELSKVRDCVNQISLDMSKLLDNRQKEHSDTAR